MRILLEDTFFYCCQFSNFKFFHDQELALHSEQLTNVENSKRLALLSVFKICQEKLFVSCLLHLLVKFYSFILAKYQILKKSCSKFNLNLQISSPYLHLKIGNDIQNRFYE